MPRRGAAQEASTSSYEWHDAPRRRQEQHPESDYDRFYDSNHQTDLQRDYQHSYGLPRERWPKGLTNIGNSCYSNSVLQCLLSTALSNALLNPQTMPLFRRYSSNHNLLALKNKNGSSDSEDEILKDPRRDQEEKEKQLRERAKSKRELAENCEWLTEELTAIAEQYQDASNRASRQQQQQQSRQRSNQSSSWWDMASYTSEAPVEQEHIINPENITRHPNRLSKCLVPYQQEDAHEFLRALLSTLVMNGRNKQLSSLFDGLLESSVTCRCCGRTSLTRDRYMDLSLDINEMHIASLPHALAEFTKNEILEKDNAVFCTRCNRKQSVTKGLRLATAPSILVCHLKRFAFDRFGRLVRLHKRVQFPLRLHIENYMSNLNKARPPPYELVGILVHQGQTCASGHYVAFVKKYGEWFQCNDSVVTKVSVETVLNQQAYICMYEVAEMRERTCYTGPSSPYQKKADKFSDEDTYTMSMDGRTINDPSTISVNSTKSSRLPNWRDEPGVRFLKLLRDAEGILTELCCDTSNSGTNEPKARMVQHNHFRTRSKNLRDDYGKDDSTVLTNDSSYPIRKSTSTDSVMDKKTIRRQSSASTSGASNNNGRSQTAPRSRRQRHNSFSGSDPGAASFFNNDGSSIAKPISPHSERDARRSRSRKRGNIRARSQGRLQGSPELPPLPTTNGTTTARRSSSGKSRRSKSNPRLYDV